MRYFTLSNTLETNSSRLQAERRSRIIQNAVNQICPDVGSELLPTVDLKKLLSARLKRGLAKSVQNLGKQDARGMVIQPLQLSESLWEEAMEKPVNGETHEDKMLARRRKMYAGNMVCQIRIRLSEIEANPDAPISF